MNSHIAATLPKDKSLLLHLIGEELKSRRLFQVLREIGVGDCYLQGDLDHVILQQLGLDDGSDETYNAYFDMMERRSREICDRDSVETQAMIVYGELMDSDSYREGKERGFVRGVGG